MDKSVSKREVQLFCKRLRKLIPFRYFFCGEYGEQYERPHYHAILFGVHWTQKNLIDACWKFGFSSLKPFSLPRAKYVAGYVQKKIYGKGSREKYAELGRTPEFSLMSKKPPIGSCFYDEERTQRDLERGYSMFYGVKTAIPRYFRRKYQTEEQKEEALAACDEEFSQLEDEIKAEILARGFVGGARAMKDKEAQREANIMAVYNMRRKRDVST